MPWSPWLLQQTSGEANLQITQIDRSSFPVIRVYVSATDDAGEAMPVAPQELQLYENGQPIEADEVSGAGEIGPLTTMLAVDISGSMKVNGKLQAAQAAAKAYVEQMQPGDQAGDRLRRPDGLRNPDGDRQALTDAVDGHRPAATLRCSAVVEDGP
jgi:hypothetical protein